MNFKSNLSCDILVVGGGTGGVFAAICGAKCGSKVILLEKNPMLGGAITSACVNFPGLFYAWGKQIISGPCWEAIKRCQALGGCSVPTFTYKPKNHWDEQIKLNRFIWLSVINEMCQESGVEVICNSMPFACENNSLLVACKEGPIKIDYKIIIDTTGDANIVSLLNYKTEKSQICQPATLQNHISDYENVLDEDIEKQLPNAEKYGLKNIEKWRINHYLSIHKIDIHTDCISGETSQGKTIIDQKAIKDLMNWYNFLRSIKGLENLTIDFIPMETGIRETVRIVGEKKVCVEDYLSGKIYNDSVCYSFYPIDLHVKKGIENIYIKENTYPTIPYGALIPKDSKNILVAGRIISSDTLSNSALRVQASAMAMGQVVGCAGSISSATNKQPKDIDLNILFKKLKDLGAIVPNYKP